MKDKKTNELTEMLENMTADRLDEYYRTNEEYLADEKKGFYYYFKDVAEAKNILLKDIYSFAGLSESWGGKIVTMERHTKNRDVILRLCIAGHFSLIEIDRALKLYGMTPLYAKDKRDAAIIVCVSNRMFDLADIDEILIKQGFDKLSAEEK